MSILSIYFILFIFQHIILFLLYLSSGARGNHRDKGGANANRGGRGRGGKGPTG